MQLDIEGRLELDIEGRVDFEGRGGDQREVEQAKLDALLLRWRAQASL